MAKTLKDLALALLNATLILVALCLFLAWKTSSTVNGMVGEFASQIEIVGPVREDVQAMTTELKGLRADLAEVKTGAASPEVVARLQTRVESMSNRLDRVEGALTGLADKPEEMISLAVEKMTQGVAEGAAQAINDVRGCTPAGGGV